MTNTQRFAATELGILIATTPDAIIRDFVPEILALCEKFGESGQSGGSAPYTATALSQAIKKLCLQEPICPVTGIDDEWMDVSEHTANNLKCFQNKRCSALFKEGSSNLSAYYLDAIIVKTQNGQTYSTNCGAICKTVSKIYGNKIYSRNYVKSFPFIPKTFYIDVIEKEVAKDDFEFYVKDERQLKRVWKYYNRYI